MSTGQKDEQTQPQANDAIPRWLSQMAPDEPGHAIPKRQPESVSRRKWIVVLDVMVAGIVIGAIVGKMTIVTEYGILRGISSGAIRGMLSALILSRKLRIVHRVIMGACVGVSAVPVSTLDIGTPAKMMLGATVGTVVAVIFGLAFGNDQTREKESESGQDTNNATIET